MSNNNQFGAGSRPFLPGEEVVVASRAEILATLDGDGSLDGLPCMPQMLELAGTRQTVYRRADKTCDTAGRTGGRRMHDTVHLDDVRCDGAAYGDCQAGCLIFWKEHWLRRPGHTATTDDEPADKAEAVAAGTRRDGGAVGDEEIHYRCQATELVRASEPLSWWNPAQYWRDWRSNRVGLGALLRAFCFWVFRQTLKLGAFRIQVGLFNRWQRMLGRTPYPFRNGTLDKTPSATLDLQPGETVRVKSHDEILATLDRNNRNRGLYFDAEMVKFCGGIFRVDQRVTKILDENSGAMIHFGSPGIILKNVFCTSKVSAMRLFCPRSIHHYWREIWLERVDAPARE